MAQQTATFSYTGAVQFWLVPAFVKAVQVSVIAGGGGPTPDGPGSLGAEVNVNMPVTSGHVFDIYVAGQGATAQNQVGSPSYTGGGWGYHFGGNAYGSEPGWPYPPGGGGGSSAIVDGTAAVLLVEAGGGGGAGSNAAGVSPVAGGNGGNPNGGNGGIFNYNPGYVVANGGEGATTGSDGAGGTAIYYIAPGGTASGSNGSSGTGGNGAEITFTGSGMGGGGGGGGCFGGGGGGAGAAGGNAIIGGGGGGGGASFVNGIATGISYLNQASPANGLITITYTPVPPGFFIFF